MAEAPAGGLGDWLDLCLLSGMLSLDLFSLLGNLPVHLGDLAFWEGHGDLGPHLQEQCNGSCHCSYSTLCLELGIFWGWEKPHLLHFGKVDRASRCISEAEEVTVVREVRSAWPFSLAFGITHTRT